MLQKSEGVHESEKPMEEAAKLPPESPRTQRHRSAHRWLVTLLMAATLSLIGEAVLQQGAKAAGGRTHVGPRAEDLLVEGGVGAKVLLFQTSGGLNNQRIILERALRICKLLDRVCLVPMAGQHSSMFTAYNKLGPAELMEMDRVLDFGLLSKYGAQVAPLSMPLTSFAARLVTHVSDPNEWMLVNQTRQERAASPITLAELERWRARPERVLYLAGPTMWQKFGKHFEDEVFPFVQYAPFFRSVAASALRGLRLGKQFVCIHSRQSDHGEKWERWMAKQEAAQSDVPRAKFAHSNGFSSQYLPSEEGLEDPGSILLHNLRYQMLKHQLPEERLKRLYLATKPTTSLDVYGNLTAAFDVRTSADLPAAVRARFDTAFELPRQQRLRNDMLGVVEQLICARAFLYMGFRGSSFSEYIRRMRREPEAKLVPPAAA